MTTSTEYGGPGADEVSQSLVLEEIAKSGTGIFFFMGFAGRTLERFGTPEQKQKYIPPLCRGENIGALMFTEAATGADPRMIETVYKADGDGYVINGAKQFVTNGAYDGPAICFAKSAETGRLSAFIIDKNCPGYNVSKQWEKMGMGAWHVVEVNLEDLRVPKGNLFGEEGNGFSLLLEHIAGERVVWAAVMLGIAQAALDEAVAYSKQRFRRETPISNTESIQYFLAEMATKVDAMRAVAYKLASMVDQGENIIVDSAKAKIFTTDTAAEVVDISQQVHGGYGYLKELKIERLYRAAKAGKIIFASNQIMRSIIAPALLR